MLANYVRGRDMPPLVTGPFAALASAAASAARALHFHHQRAWAHNAEHWVQDGDQWELAGYMWQPDGPHRSPFVITKVLVPETSDDRIGLALAMARQAAGEPAPDRLAWVIDQMVRALTGDEYDEFVTQARDGYHGPSTFTWNTGVAP